MKPAQKVALGVLAVAALGGAAYVLTRKKAPANQTITVQKGTPNVTVKYQNVQLDLTHLTNANTGTDTIYRYQGTVVI